MIRPLRVAVIGCGRIGVSDSSRFNGQVHSSLLPVGHAESIVKNDVFELVGFCDSVQEKSLAAAIQYNRGRGFGDVSKMVDECRPDIVTIATRSDVRPKIIESVLSKGCVRGIYAEKPFCRSVAEARSCIEHVKSSGAHLVVGTPRRYLEVYREASRIANDGQLGELLEIRFGMAPKSQLLWTCTHYVDLMTFFAGCLEVVTIESDCEIAESKKFGNQIDCDPLVRSAVIKFSNGVSAFMQESDSFDVSLICQRGKIRIDEGNSSGPLLQISRSGEEPEERKVCGSRSGVQQALEDLAFVVRGGEMDLISLDEVVVQQTIVSGIAQSGANCGMQLDDQEVQPDLIVTGKFGDLYP